MKFAIATIATLATLAVGATAFAASAPREPLPEVSPSVINAGPVSDDANWWTSGQAEIQYLHQVCPTVMHSPNQYSASLVRFCQEAGVG